MAESGPVGSAWAPGGPVSVAPTGSGTLDGVRVVIKDLYDVTGTRTVAGTPARLSAEVATRSATVVERLLAAGADVVGKTATDELAMGMFGANTHFGTPLNAAAADRMPGGSTSGSATLVAAGEAELGIGTDTGGSIRVPTSFQGLVGLRPTHGRIPLDGVVPMAPAFDTCGLLGRDVAIVATAFAVLARGVGAALGDGPGPRSAATLTRLVLLTDLVEQATDEVAALTRRTAERWARTWGLDLVEERLVEDPSADLVSVFWPLMSRQLWLANGAWVRAERPVLGEGIEERILAAADVTDDQVAAAAARRDALVARLGTLLDGAVAVLPTTIDAAPPRTLPHSDLMAWRDRNLALVVPASLAGVPQLTVPAGRIAHPRTGTSAPVGVSLLGLAGDDELLLRLAAALTAGEQA
ncbi:amidase family protein [Nocardioides sp.]|uniref:amidase family protein n=1 Tax=Nocardioides sp. TaxID=35761 RepID=UPI002625C6A5|nr:amidase family protein [Nocardioides sp.]